MRNKNTITILLAIFAVICAVNLYYTYRAFNMESEYNNATPEKQAELDKDKDWKSSFSKAQGSAFALGLDLQGGLFVTMEVGVEDILLEYAGTSADRFFKDALARALEIKKTSQEPLVDLFYGELKKVYAENKKQEPKYLLAKYFSSKTRDIAYNASDDEILGRLGEDSKAAYENAFKIIRTRIDQFGVSSPNLQKQQGSGRILLELPGVKDVKRVKQLLRNSAKLEFRETHTYNEAYPTLDAINRVVRRLEGVKVAGDSTDNATAESDTTKKDTLLAGDGDPNVPDNANVGAVEEGDDAVVADGDPNGNADGNQDGNEGDQDGNAVADAGNEDGNNAGNEDANNAANENNGNVATDVDDLFGGGNTPPAPTATTTSDSGDSNAAATAATSTAASDSNLTDEQKREKFIAENPFFSKFVWSNQIDGSMPLMGYVSVNDTAAINAWMDHPDVKVAIPQDMKFLWEAKPSASSEGSADSDDAEKDLLGLIAIKTNRDDKAPLEGSAVTSARQDFEQYGSTNAIVSMKMNSEGAKIWSRITKENVGKAVAIVLDNMIYSYPRVNGVISGGNSQISGNFTVDEAKDLANLLKAGALPVKAKILGDNQIGPTLGADNLNKGLISFFIAFLVTIVFMAFYYRGSGLVANVALVANLFFILGVSAALNVVFTLPGLAAVVLTMGMAVDANVLIFERIREEQALGKSFKASISSGFKNAFSSVMDANITTFLTGLILFTFGLGPIKGFAVSLMIGIITSLISALFITRLILDYFATKGRDSIKFGSNMTTGIFSKIDMKMTKRKRIMYVVSGILVAGSLVSFFTNGFRTGVDLEGGRMYKVAFNQSVKPADVRKGLNEAFDGTIPLIRSMAGDTALLVTTSYLIEEDTATEYVTDKMLASFEASLPGSNAKVLEANNVGPTVADDIQTSARFAIIFSLLIIFMYILIRFRKPQYSVGAIAALFHDVIIVLGIFSVVGTLDILPFPLELDQAIIAALLTIIGYSINDTVVVFDRIRENFNEMRTKSVSEVYDTSINQTISRTMITSVTTMLTILVLFFMGGEGIRSFMFALLVGIVVGTYSSIFVASPISHDLLMLQGDKAAPVKQRKEDDEERNKAMQASQQQGPQRIGGRKKKNQKGGGRKIGK